MRERASEFEFGTAIGEDDKYWLLFRISQGTTALEHEFRPSEILPLVFHLLRFAAFGLLFRK